MSCIQLNNFVIILVIYFFSPLEAKAK